MLQEKDFDVEINRTITDCRTVLREISSIYIFYLPSVLPILKYTITFDRNVN